MRTDSATTERMPPGPKSRASVAMTWTKRMTRSRISRILARTANPQELCAKPAIRHRQLWWHLPSGYAKRS